MTRGLRERRGGLRAARVGCPGSQRSCPDAWRVGWTSPEPERSRPRQSGRPGERLAGAVWSAARRVGGARGVRHGPGPAKLRWLWRSRLVSSRGLLCLSLRVREAARTLAKQRAVGADARHFSSSRESAPRLISRRTLSRLDFACSAHLARVALDTLPRSSHSRSLPCRPRTSLPSTALSRCVCARLSRNADTLAGQSQLVRRRAPDCR